MTTEALDDAQRRVLLAEMAQRGSAAAEENKQVQDVLAQQKKAALKEAIGVSSQAGGTNDVGGLLDRRAGSSQQGEIARQGDLAQRTAAYSADLGLAQQANVSRLHQIDQGVATRRSELDRQIAGRRQDMETQLAMKRLEFDNQRRQADQEHAWRLQDSGKNTNTPMYQAEEEKARQYLADPTGELAARRKAQAEDAVFAKKANIDTTGHDASAVLADVRRHPDYVKGVGLGHQAQAAGLSPDQYRDLLEGRVVLNDKGEVKKVAKPTGGVNPVARDLLLTQYLEAFGAAKAG